MFAPFQPADKNTRLFFEKIGLRSSSITNFSSVKIDNASGIGEENCLRTQEYGNSNIVFKTEISTCRSAPRLALKHLIYALLYMENFGKGRRRGSGKCEIIINKIFENNNEYEAEKLKKYIKDLLDLKTEK